MNLTPSGVLLRRRRPRHDGFEPGLLPLLLQHPHCGGLALHELRHLLLLFLIVFVLLVQLLSNLDFLFFIRIVLIVLLGLVVAITTVNVELKADRIFVPGRAVAF